MMFSFKPLEKNEMDSIATWRYADGKSLYMRPYFLALKENKRLRGPGGCEGFAAYYKGHLAGLFEFTMKDKGLVIGLALRPNLVGKGLGVDFVLQGIHFGIEYYEYTDSAIYLDVAQNNKAAIAVYRRIGFYELGMNGKDIRMKLELF
ncbi:MAG: GNAT family N-acetyltransferase [Bacteroidetes bacterium]|nr:GNAT family N-acetyltransferase [Bacteroidota bacterium]